ncbi:MAG: ABC transporter ATP-binding protein [Proteobacteria bacterium]|nr:ABC transporter ATP-binding protein [Pseudomonadota bacterium]
MSDNGQTGDPPVLSVRDLTMGFCHNSQNGRAAPVLSGLSLSVSRGELVCVLGPSGCGKTTLLKILAGFAAGSAGQVLVEGSPKAGPGPDRCMVFQEDALFPWLTVGENVAFGLTGPRKEKRAEAERFLSLVGLSGFSGCLPHEISGGQKQRVALARVFALSPRVLLMDEPFGSLDALTRRAMWDLLLSLWAELSQTIVFVTHDPVEAVFLADRVLLLAGGRFRREIPVNLPRPRSRKDFRFFPAVTGLEEALEEVSREHGGGVGEKRKIRADDGVPS